MLLFNFICLFYLMVLIDSHTISKNIAYNNALDDIVDSINDLQYNKEYWPGHGGIHHYNRREYQEAAATPKNKEDSTKKVIAAQNVAVASKTTALIQTTASQRAAKHSRIFWKKFHRKFNETKEKSGQHKRRIPKRGKYYRQYSNRPEQYFVAHRHLPTRNTEASQVSNGQIDKMKREATTRSSTTIKRTTISKTTDTPTTTPLSSSKSLTTFRIYSTKKKDPPEDEFLSKADLKIYTPISTSTRIANLNKSYSTSKTTSTPSEVIVDRILQNLNKPESKAPTVETTTNEFEYTGTAQLEAFLNNIKEKAAIMVAQHNPGVTEIISNTVTETTFTADPILTHLRVITPRHPVLYRSTVPNDYSSDNIEIESDVQNLESNDTVVISNTEPTHLIGARSIQEDAYTIAQSIEDILQKELKKVVKKVKSKVTCSSHCHTQAKHHSAPVEKPTTKVKPKSTPPHESTTHTTKPLVAPKEIPKTIKPLNKEKESKHSRRSTTNDTEESTTASSEKSADSDAFNDDYMMLSLFEQILTRTHQDNIMKMLTTSDVPIFTKRMSKDIFKFKRDIEATSNDYNINDDVKKVMEQISKDLPDYYSTLSTKPYDPTTQQANEEDVSYAGLSSKISYNEFVNGYKHYLKFQQEQGQQNFSNLVKYQAHRHHSVDDIGKFILNKIPQIPQMRKKRFFDDDTMDDQDVSTKSDDSWFKKHFYMFIDNGTPKKFHTSQTVELKSPITDPDSNSDVSSTQSVANAKIKKGFTERTDKIDGANKRQDQKETIGITLDYLAKTLDDHKIEEFTSIEDNQATTQAVSQNTESNISERVLLKNVGPFGFVEKLFGHKGRRTPKHRRNQRKQKTYTIDDNDSFNEDIERPKRSDIEGIYDTKTFTHPTLTYATDSIDTKNKNYGYVDVNLIPRPTAIVKLRENKEEKGKLKKFLSKFHFRKHKKDKKKKQDKSKRDVRSQRCNVLEKFKQIFKSGAKEEKKGTKKAETTDFEMMSSHIDTFKPVKYIKTLSVDEIRKQIPNIPQPTLGYDSEAVNYAKPNFDFSLDFNEVNDKTFLSEHTTVAQTVNPVVITGSTRLSTKPPKLKFSKKYRTTTMKFFTPDLTESYSATLEQITNKFNEKLENITMSLPTSRNKIDFLNKEMKTMQNELKSLNLKIGAAKTITNYSTTNPTLSYMTPKYTPLETYDPMSSNNLKIHEKMTRMAKFPLTHFKNYYGVKGDKRYFHGDNDMGESKRDVKALKSATPVSKLLPVANYTVLSRLSYKPYPDYFNDLLMWHSDILNADKITEPSWEGVMKSIKEKIEYTTQSVLDMQKELSELQSAMSLNDKNRTKKRKSVKAKSVKVKPRSDNFRRQSSFSKSPNIIKTVALSDDALATANDIIIRGEAKYYHVVRQPTNYSKTLELLKSLSEELTETPAADYETINNNESKRNDEFWSNIEVKNKEDQNKVIFIDTTLLAYDDGVDFLTEKPLHKKISKNSLTAMSSKKLGKKASPKPVTKMNQSPEQYFSTPLPMKMGEFEKFLKDNEIDVQSVTSPLADTTYKIAAASQTLEDKKKETHECTEKKIQYNLTTELPVLKAEKLPYQENKARIESGTYFFKFPVIQTNETKLGDTRTYITYPIKTLELNDVKETTDINQLLRNFDIRMKRNTEYRNSDFYDSNLYHDTNKQVRSGIFKKKINFFTKNITSTTPTTFSNFDKYTVISPESDPFQDVELTIIHIDDDKEKEIAKHTSNTFDSYKNMRMSKTTALFNNDQRKAHETNTQRSQKKHNTMLYKHVFYTTSMKKTNKGTNITTTTMMPISDAYLSKILSDYTTTTSLPVTTKQHFIENEVLNKLRSKNPPHPKRVKISSHSYKYDIIYNENKKRKLSQKRFQPPYITTTPAYNYDSNDQSENTTASLFDGETTLIPNWREKRRLKIFSNIRRKIGSLLGRSKSSSTLGAASLTTFITTQASTVSTTERPLIKPNISSENTKMKREKPNEINKERLDFSDVNMDYNFNLSKFSDPILETGVKKIEKNSGKYTRQIFAIKQIPDTTTLSYQEVAEVNKMLINNYDENIQSTPYWNNIHSTLSNVEKDFRKDNSDHGFVEVIRTDAQVKPAITNLHTTSGNQKDLIGNDYKEKEQVYYFDILGGDSRNYYEPGSDMSPTTRLFKYKKTPKTKHKTSETKLEKRDVQEPNIYTAKDVAAIEVIVDLVKNTASFEELDDSLQKHDAAIQTAPYTTTTAPTTKEIASSNSTPYVNAMQVHIAVPYNLQIGKKRSLDPLRVRKVFVAKMFTPVDLEYQVHSFEEDKAAKGTGESAANQPQLLLFKSGNPNKKPVPGKNKGKVSRQVTKMVEKQNVETTTSNANNLGKVTLSKDFVAAVNEHLVQLYENLTTITEASGKHHIKVRKTDKFENVVSNYERGFRRHINWETVKKYFGHDRVCNCKCKENRTMCRACAACDAVISELIFEFDNLAEFMRDHCTEIQTYFWMNPSGGKKLRDTVHKIDSTLHDYFKRVKGKCQGRTCNTYSTCIDRRSIVTSVKLPKRYIGPPLLYDLDRLASDIEIASMLDIGCPQNLIEFEENFVGTIENCFHELIQRQVPDDLMSTASVKNVYSLDNINVNIICKPSDEATYTTVTPAAYNHGFYKLPEEPILTTYPTKFEYKYAEDRARKGMRNFFARSHPPILEYFTYYVTESISTDRFKKNHKRQTQIESPLISDTGGAFWQDYLQNKHQLRNIRDALNDEGNTNGTTGSSNLNSYSTNLPSETDVQTTPQMDVTSGYKAITYTNPEKQLFARNVKNTADASLDTLTQNIDVLFKIFHNITDLKDVNNLSKNNDKGNLYVAHTTDSMTTESKKESTTSKILKTIKSKFHFRCRTRPKSTKMKTPVQPTVPYTPCQETSQADLQKLLNETAKSDSSKCDKTCSTESITKSIEKSSAILKSTVDALKKNSSSTKPCPKAKPSSSAPCPTTKSKVTPTPKKGNCSLPKTSAATTKCDENISKGVTPNLFGKIKLATIDFFYKGRKHDKTTESSDKRRSLPTDAPTFNKTTSLAHDKDLNATLKYNDDDSVNVISQETTEDNPTIIIINDYNNDDIDTEYKLVPNNLDSISDLNMSKDEQANIKGLLLTVLNYEAKKLKNEWRRFKKENSKTESSIETITKNIVTRDMPNDFVLSTSHCPPKITCPPKPDLNYDMVKDITTKSKGLIQKLVNKFGERKPPGKQHPHAGSKACSSRQQTHCPQNRQKKHQMKTCKGVQQHTPKSITRSLLPDKTQMIPCTTTFVASTDLRNSEEAADEQNGQQNLCDVDATLKYIKYVQKLTNKDEFETFLKHITCFKYKKAPKVFIIDKKTKRRNRRRKFNKDLTENGMKWDWIRKKRSLKYYKRKRKISDNDETEDTTETEQNVENSKETLKLFDDTVNNHITQTIKDHNVFDKSVNFIIEDDESFDTFARGENGIYQRKKRSTFDIEELVAGLTKLPYTPGPNETYTMHGDSVIINCFPKNNNAQKTDKDGLHWDTDRKEMLHYENVAVDSHRIFIKGIEPRNQGDYICQKGDFAQKRVRLTVITLPTVRVIFTPTYSINQDCSYDVLKMVQCLGAMFFSESCTKDQYCSVRIDEPVCLKDRSDGSAYIRVTAVMTLTPRKDVVTSAKARRDLHTSLVLLGAENAPVLSNIEVMILNNYLNKTLKPTIPSKQQRFIVTHTLRRKDSNGHQEFIGVGSRLAPGSVSVLLACPAGHYLKQDSKICAACPAGSWSQEGDNTCQRCPRGAHSIPGEPHCRALPTRDRRYGWWWWAGCGWCAAWGGAACACAAATFAHVRRRAGCKRGNEGTSEVKDAQAPHARARPLSPSRVILAKFFKGSRSSTGATDSQTKFGQWKEKNMPPPLPPIDFDS